MDKLSVIIVTRNEERKIKRCLDTVCWADEIVIVDQSSDDDTVKLSKEYTDKVYVVDPKGYCEPDRKVAVSHTANEWILYLDADELVSPELKEEIMRVLSGQNKNNSYYIPRKNIFLDKWIKGSGWYPGYVLRLFKKSYVNFSDNIHTDAIPITRSGYFKNPIIHYTCENIDEYLYKMNSYTSILAFQAYKKGVFIGSTNCIIKLFLVPLSRALHKYLFQAGYKDGFYGFIIACFTFLTVFMMNSKLWEIQYSDTFNMKLHTR